MKRKIIKAVLFILLLCVAAVGIYAEDSNELFSCYLESMIPVPDGGEFSSIVISS